MNKPLLVGGAVVLAFIGYMAAAPYLAVSAIKTGITEQDSEKLSDYIEFPTLRQNLKDQLNIIMMANAAKELDDNPFSALAAGFATTMVDTLVDSFVTPSGLAKLMSGESSSSDKPSPNSSTTQETNTQEEDLFKQAESSYDSLSKFSIWVPNEDGDKVRFVLNRDGISWKLVNIVLPENKK